MNTAYVIAVITSLKCGVDVLCRQAVEPDWTREHAPAYSTPDACTAALNRLRAKVQQDAKNPFLMQAEEGEE